MAGGKKRSSALEKACTNCNSAPPTWHAPVRHHGCTMEMGPIEVRSKPGDNEGRAVHATRAVARGERLHRTPCIKFSREEYLQHAKHTTLEHYLFNLPSGERLLALGVGSLFNHHRRPNVDYRLDGAASSISYVAARAVAAGEELCISYGAEGALWFTPVYPPGEAAAGEEELEDGAQVQEDFLGGIGALSDDEEQGQEQEQEQEELEEEPQRRRRPRAKSTARAHVWSSEETAEIEALKREVAVAAAGGPAAALRLLRAAGAAGGSGGGGGGGGQARGRAVHKDPSRCC